MKKNNFYWIGLTDLMTSLFFVMLIISCILLAKNASNAGAENAMVLLKQENSTLSEKVVQFEDETTSLKLENSKLGAQVNLFENETKVLKKEKELITAVQKNIEQLQKRDDLFFYESKFKRYALRFDVQFYSNRYMISESALKNYADTRAKLADVGSELYSIIDELSLMKQQDTAYKDVSYLIVVAGSASNVGDENHNYELSYKRAYNLYRFWKDELGIDFDNEKFHSLVEFQIAGNGVGGVGRFETGPARYSRKNQRFIINVIPKMGKI